MGRKKYRKPDYRRKVERLLRQYPLLKVAVEQLEKEYPSCIPMYELERVQGGDLSNSTQSYATRRAEKKILLERIEKALEVLNLDERFLIEEKYFDLNCPPDDIICHRLGWSQRTYYRIKQQAIEKLAFVLDLK
ncbi:ArpU family phage packaging/lysis transcriptional regulator [Thermoflavimicrobium dichotomicum]|uniref:Phage transcriptional regulator, ArpU family n=1 Tax=Thermoflavimicrobium dichotomicum TaxID=46223 RepID=A0A1I3UJG5_9BACL|nr:ArpU family phage packaging/lysis transcriptional regulator [Thermoflavimicrobium dichotomicum]SFJ82853.1 phage transcriptional regulator, ArpU family [Thermoflavimicrobium dichotomicum]